MADVIGVQILQRFGHSQGAFVVLVEHDETILAVEAGEYNIGLTTECRVNRIDHLLTSANHRSCSHGRLDIDFPQIRVRHFLRQPVERLGDAVLFSARDDPFPLQCQIGKDVFNGPR